jgi:hypothetical protein
MRFLPLWKEFCDDEFNNDFCASHTGVPASHQVEWSMPLGVVTLLPPYKCLTSLERVKAPTQVCPSEWCRLPPWTRHRYAMLATWRCANVARRLRAQFQAHVQTFRHRTVCRVYGVRPLCASICLLEHLDYLVCMSFLKSSQMQYIRRKPRALDYSWCLVRWLRYT